jgi:hypothetical protein
MSSIISVQLDALEELAVELQLLAGELDDDAARCSRAAAGLSAGLSRDEGLTAIGAASTWAALTAAVADGTRAVSGGLAAAVASYRAAEAARAASIGRVRTHHPAVLR